MTHRVILFFACDPRMRTKVRQEVDLESFANTNRYDCRTADTKYPASDSCWVHQVYIMKNRSFFTLRLANFNNQMILAFMIAQYDSLKFYECALIISYILLDAYNPQRR